MILTVLLIAAFLLGTLMPRSTKIEEKVITKVERDTVIHTQLKSVPIEVEKTVKEYIYIQKVDTIFVNDTIYVGLPRQYYFSETGDVKIWHSGIDSRIDSLVNFRQTEYIEREVWKRHSIGISGDIGFNMLGLEAEYEYDLFKWFSVRADVGYDFYMKQPYISAGAKIRLYSW